MEELLRNILDTIGEGIIFQEASGAIKYFNQAAQRIFGITEDEAKLRTSLHSEWHLVYEDGSPCPGEEHPSMITLSTGQALNDQILGIAKPGQPVVWLSINTRPIFRPGQELPQAVVISFNDITDRKRTEEELKESQARYQAIFETNQAPKLLIDPADGAIVEANQAACQFYGYTLEEIKLKKITDINALPPEVVKEEMKQAKLKDRLVFQFRHQLKSGEVRDVEVYSGPVQENGRILLHSIVFDVTECKRAAEALKKSEERYRDIASALTGITWEMDDNFVVTLLSGGVHEVIGYEPDEIIGRNPFFLIDPGDRERVSAVMAQLPQEGKKAINIEYWCRHKDGRRIRIMTSCVPFFAQDGAFLGSRGTHLDVTEAYWARRRKEIILELNKMSADSDTKISAFLCEACAEFTDSPMAFFGLVEPDQSAMIAHVWSPQVMTECMISDKPLCFPIGTAGLWADPVRRREPVIVNDYAGCVSKRGLPDGHVPITRYLGVPIVDDGKVIAVAGAANKPAEYGDRHVERLRLILSLIANFLSMRRKETELGQREESYRALVDGLPDIVMRFDREGRHLFVSQNVREVVDIEASAFIGKTHAELGFPEAQCRFWGKAIRKVFDSGDTFETEFAYEGKAGTVIFNWRLVPERDNQGAVSSVLSISRDMTARKQAEAQLRQSMQTAADLVSAIPSGLFIYQFEPPDSLILLAGNPEAQRLTGISEKEFEGREFNEIWPQAKEDGVTDKYLEVMRTGKTYEIEDLHYQDNRLSGAYRIRAFNLPGQRLAVAFEDVTSIRKAEVRLLEQEKVLTDILEDTLSGYWDWNLVDNTEYLSPAFKKMFGYEDHELPNSPEIWQRLIFPDDLPSVLEVFDRHVKSHGREPYYNEIRYRHKDGSTVWVICAGRVIEWAADGSPIRMVGCHVDITERKQAEEQIRKARDQAEQYLEVVEAIIVALDPQGRVTLINRKGCQLLGCTEEEILGKNWFAEFLPQPEGMEQVYSAFLKLMAGKMEGVDYYENPVLTRTGEQRIVAWHNTYLRGEHNEIIGALSAGEDITERKLAEEALRESEERNRHILYSAMDGFWRVDAQLRLMEVNDAYCRMSGYSREDLLTMRVPDLEAQETPEEVSDRAEQLIENGFNRFTSRHRRKDGSLMDVEVSIAYMPGGGRGEFAVFLRDITERLHTERELRISEERFRLAFDTSPDAININRLEDGLYVHINQGFTSLTGFTADDVKGRTSLEIDIWADPADRLNLLRDLREKGYCENLEANFRLKDGSLVTALMSARVISLGEVPHILSITRDITELRRLEAQFMQAQKMEAIGTLAGGIAHDFNNILGAVMGFAEMARDMARENQDPGPDINEVIKAGERARDLVKQILTFSRKVEVDLKPLNLNNEVKHATELLSRTIPKMIIIETRLAEDLMPVLANDTQVEQILLNLGANAQDAMPDGGRLVIETQNVILDQESCGQYLEVKPGDYVLLQVSDTGAGMDEQTREHIFEPFFTTKGVGKGTGLGLATVFGIVKGFGGHIFCYSEPGKGATFKIFLPAYQQQVITPQADPWAPQELMEGTETLLLVDDEEALRNVGSRTLTRAGYRVLTAQSGEEALRIYGDKQNAIDLVILDLGMPGMGGHKALKAILKINPRAKVLIASGYAADFAVKDALQSGAAGYVAKPFQKGELLSTLRALLDQDEKA